MSYPERITRTIPAFRYIAPETMAEAINTLKQAEGKGKVLAGGTDLLPLMKHRVISPESVVSLKKVPDLAYVREDNGSIRIGALTRISTIEKSNLIKEKCLSLYEATRKFASVPVKNMATIGGNICRSSPSADMVPPLLAFDAILKVVGPEGEREILLNDFFTGPGTNVLQQEILTEVVIPLKEKKYGTAFAKVTRNSADLAKVNCAVWIAIDNGTYTQARIALGAVAPTPIRARNAENTINGRKVGEETITLAEQKIIDDIAPVTDVRSTREYRAEVAKVLVTRLLRTATERVR